ncbi:MAG: hydrogenase formation protein HypD [Candidatus Aminicenantes bacterium]|nr:hydrogenase formation protein HypD [Candidatus Aminicenantes bacterium]
MDKKELQTYADKLKNLELERPIRIMEVCGTHTTQFFYTGVKDLFPEKLSLIDGPGCPVCVTPNRYLDRAIEIARTHEVWLVTFGDMMRVPSSYSSLQKEKAVGVPIHIVYSPLDALTLAQENPEKQVVFLSVGFETTIPTEAVAVKKARQEKLKNFSILTGNKLTPPAVRALLDAGEVKIDGFILPGHVSVITGIKGWRFVADKYEKPCVITGFETQNLLIGTMALIHLIQNGNPEIINEYSQVVTESGNEKAQEVMAEVFESTEAKWRGIGTIPESGLCLKEPFQEFDANLRFPVNPPEEVEPRGCRCGEVLRGLVTPLDCPLFGKKCLPETPVGACMVSSEGACAAYFRYQKVSP